MIILQISERKETAHLITNLGSILYIYLYATITVFFIFLTDSFPKKRKVIIPLIFIPAVILSYHIIQAEHLVELVRINNTWIMGKLFYDKILFIIFHNVGFLFYLIFCTVLLIVWRKKAKLAKQKKQFKIILITLALGMYIGPSVHFVLFEIIKILPPQVPGVIGFFFLIWIFGIWYAMVKYRFLSINPSTFSNSIIGNIDEAIIMLDPSNKIIVANDRAKALINNKELEGMNLSELIVEYETVRKEIIDMTEDKTENFSCRCNFKADGKENLLMDTKYSMIKDEYNDIVGILIIAKEVKEIKQLSNAYKITEREVHVIQKILSGESNEQIAEEFNITLNTMKKHLGNIYAKLEVNSKVELINLLKDFNLIPEQKADRTLLFLNSKE